MPVPFNPRNPHYDSKIIRVTVTNVPLSADDGQIQREFTLRNIEILNFSRERLKVDNKLTNCETGKRIVICKTFEKPLPKSMKMGRYTAKVHHFGQLNDKDNPVFLCNKCLMPGHTILNCENEWKCRKCFKFGHQMLDCPDFLKTKMTSKNSEDKITDTQETVMPQMDDHDHLEIANQIAEVYGENESQPSQSILPSENGTNQTNRKKTKAKDKKKKEHDQSEPNKQSAQSTKSKSEQEFLKSTTKSGHVSFQKQTNMNSYITPNRKSGQANSGRTPPTPPDRGGSKVPKPK